MRAPAPPEPRVETRDERTCTWKAVILVHEGGSRSRELGCVHGKPHNAHRFEDELISIAVGPEMVE